MHIHDHFAAADGPTLSFEFFPPRTPEASVTLSATLAQLAPLAPAFVSVTYGAGGGTREFTATLVDQLRQGGCYDPIPHLTCVGHAESEIQRLLERYAQQGIGNLLALRGDLPPGSRLVDFTHAADLVRYIKRFNERGLHADRRGFGIGVACFPEGHPATPNRLLEMDHLKAKVDAGADYLCTQAFFENRDFYDFRERCALAGIHVPILAGILPLTTASGMRRMAALAGGMRYPAKLLRALQRAQGDAAAFGHIALHHATEQVADLLHKGVHGIHFYTLNQSSPVREILRRVAWKVH